MSVTKKEVRIIIVMTNKIIIKMKKISRLLSILFFGTLTLIFLGNAIFIYANQHFGWRPDKISAEPSLSIYITLNNIGLAVICGAIACGMKYWKIPDE
jgi:hypothetical protein